jgi:NitT/TauT family transport system ATP-binding protein
MGDIVLPRTESEGLGGQCLARLQHVGKSFVSAGKRAEILSDVNIDIAPGEFVSLIGPSGSGKSTILNLLAGIDMPTSGTVVYDGDRVRGVSRTIAYLTQHDSLLPWRTVADNVGVPLEIRNVPAPERARAVEEILVKVGLEGYGKHYPRQLSGGMQKRTMLARTLIYDPKTILMDEPFGPLDAQLKLALQAELLRLWTGTGKTIVFVTHDIAEAITLSDRVLVLSSQPTVIKHEERILIPRPRDVHEVRFSPHFEAHYRALWNAIELRREQAVA